MAKYAEQAYSGIDKMVDIDLTTGSDANSDGDLVADVQVIADAVHLGGTSTLQSLRLLNRDDNDSAVDIVFLNSSNTLGTENAAIVTSDVDLEGVETVVEFIAGDYTDLGSGKVAVKGPSDGGMGVLMAPSDATTDTLYVAAVSRDTDAYSSNGIQLRIGLSRR